MHAQTLEAAEWWARPRLEKSDAWIANYKNSLTTRHRVILSKIVGELQATSVLEVACHCAPNLVRFAIDHPSIHTLRGFDVNADAIDDGRNWIASKGLSSRISLATGNVHTDLADLPDGFVDVVLSCYGLAYIAPPDLDAVLWEMGRIATKAVILAEPMSDTDTKAHTMLNGYQEWAHNYTATAKWMSTWQGMTLRTAMVDPPVDHLERVLVAVRE